MVRRYFAERLAHGIEKMTINAWLHERIRAGVHGGTSNNSKSVRQLACQVSKQYVVAVQHSDRGGTEDLGLGLEHCFRKSRIVPGGRAQPP